MRRHTTLVVPAIALLLILPATSLRAQTREAAVVDGARRVLGEIMSIPARKIPQSLLAHAQGVAIIPNVVKGGFIVGVRHGRGVVVVRDIQGHWKPPMFVTLTGGSVGWQAGVQATDVVLVFTTRKSVDGLLSGKFTVGADAAAAAGPVGRQATAATDAQLKAEIYSYSRSRGLFAGVSLDGSALQIDQRAYQAYYRSSQLPASAVRLLEQIANYTGTPEAGPAAGIEGHEGAVTLSQAESIRRQLASSLPKLHALLDSKWKTYLALPAEVLTGNKPPSIEALSRSLTHFNKVADDRRYRALAQRSEFQTTHELLKKYISIRAPKPSPGLKLPPPPPESDSNTAA